MANDEKNAPGTNEKKDAGGSPGTDPWRKKGYDEERPGYDVDVDTDAPTGKEAAREREREPDPFDAPARPKGRPEMDPTHPRGAPETRDLPTPKLGR